MKNLVIKISSNRWSPQFIDFVSRCLVKTPEKRATASQLLHSDFIVAAGPSQGLADMIAEVNTELSLVNFMAILTCDWSTSCQY